MEDSRQMNDTSLDYSDRQLVSQKVSWQRSLFLNVEFSTVFLDSVTA